MPPRPTPVAPVRPAVGRNVPAALPDRVLAPSAAAPRSRRAPRGTFEPAFVTRKRLTGQELLAAGGVGLAIGLACFYVAKVWIERSDVLPPAPRPPVVPTGAPAEGAVNRTVTPQRAAP